MKKIVIESFGIEWDARKQDDAPFWAAQGAINKFLSSNTEMEFVQILEGGESLFTMSGDSDWSDTRRKRIYVIFQYLPKNL